MHLYKYTFKCVYQLYTHEALVRMFRICNIKHVCSVLHEIDWYRRSIVTVLTIFLTWDANDLTLLWFLTWHESGLVYNRLLFHLFNRYNYICVMNNFERIDLKRNKRFNCFLTRPPYDLTNWLISHLTYKWPDHVDDNNCSLSTTTSDLNQDPNRCIWGWYYTACQASSSSTSLLHLKQKLRIRWLRLKQCRYCLRSWLLLW